MNKLENLDEQLSPQRDLIYDFTLIADVVILVRAKQSTVGADALTALYADEFKRLVVLLAIL